MENKITKFEPKSDCLIPSTAEFSQLKEICTIAVKSGLIPQKTAEQAIIVALKGREVGIPPMQAFAHIAVINGKPSMSSELMLALAYQRIPGVKIEFLESNEKICRIKFTRPGEAAEEWPFSMDEAIKAGVAGKAVWKQYPAAMLRARAISAVARAKFPDALMGISYTPEELGGEPEVEVKEAPTPILEAEFKEKPIEIGLHDRIQKMLTAFDSIGVSLDEIENHLVKKVKDFTDADLEQLKEFYKTRKSMP